jgi:Leucine rich repeat
MTRDSKLPKTNSLLPSINYKQFIALIILLLVTSSTTQSPSAKYDCPSGCECNETDLSARCDNLDELIASYSQKQHKIRHNFMPIKSLDLSNNQLTKLTNQLELLVNVTELNLSHNQLTQVHKLNFANLEKLDLSHNRITSAKLKKLPKNVIHLNLANNEITYMPVDFMKLKKLRSLELAGNPLNCTCNTLHVRNWITYHHVWSDKTILCASPMTVKGQPWLQARQNDICIEPSSTTTQRSKYNWDNYEDDNEIMMADQPQDDTDKTETDVEYDEDEPEEETPEDDKPVEDETPADEDTPTNDDEKPTEDDSDKDNKDIWKNDEKPEDNEEKPEADDNDDDKKDEQLIPVSQEPEPDHDGSSVEPETVSHQATDEGSADGEEGSGGVAIHSVSEEPEEGEESGSGIPSLGIFDDRAEPTVGTVVQKDSLTDVNAPENLTPADVEKASQENITGTYILLGILALCLVSLMAFVAMKNRKEKNRNRRYDVEKNGATELQDMDKSLLGKPLDKNGNGNGKAPEQSPLINEYPIHKEDRPTYASFQPPEITVDGPKAAPRDRSQQNLNENIPNGNGHVEPVHQSPINGSVPRSPDSDDEIFHPANGSPDMPASLNVSPEPAKRYSPIYTSQSPRSDRYSPVYSPETGRVKIKLTETPKPKTPLVVTRSRSRAGDYVNTPN